MAGIHYVGWGPPDRRGERQGEDEADVPRHGLPIGEFVVSGTRWEDDASAEWRRAVAWGFVFAQARPKPSGSSVGRVYGKCQDEASWSRASRRPSGHDRRCGVEREWQVAESEGRGHRQTDNPEDSVPAEVSPGEFYDLAGEVPRRHVGRDPADLRRRRCGELQELAGAAFRAVTPWGWPG